LTRVSAGTPDGDTVLLSNVKLQTNFSTLGMKSCVLAFDGSTDRLSLVSEDGATEHFARPITALDSIKWERQRQRLVVEVDGEKHRILFQSAGGAIGAAFLQRSPLRGLADRLVTYNGLEDWLAMLAARGLIAL